MPSDAHPPTSPADDVTDVIGHPRGTLAIVLAFAALFALGWFAFYLLRFMEQGATHH